MKIHEKYIKRCLELAKNGLGLTRPNPMVGCVIVYEGSIIGEGFTSPYGGNHAEVNAIHSVKDKELLRKATLYVSLEPCNHYGKTPPCSDLIIRHQIPNIVVGCIDSFKAVAGKGIQKLKDTGCNVIVGVLEDECKVMNKRFFTFHNQKRPYVILKWAKTKDGFVAPNNSERDEKKPVWITNSYSRQLVHKWRTEEQAILVGTNTVIDDNPKLDVRNWSGQNPIRLVLDKSLRIPNQNKVLDGNIKTIVFTDKHKDDKPNLKFKKIDFANNIPQQICDYLYQNDIQSVIIEGGSQTLQSFIDSGLWDEARVFIGSSTFVEGTNAPYIYGVENRKAKIGADTLRIIQNKEP